MCKRATSCQSTSSRRREPAAAGGHGASGDGTVAASSRGGRVGCTGPWWLSAGSGTARKGREGMVSRRWTCSERTASRQQRGSETEVKRQRAGQCHAIRRTAGRGRRPGRSEQHVVLAAGRVAANRRKGHTYRNGWGDLSFDKRPKRCGPFLSPAYPILICGRMQRETLHSRHRPAGRRQRQKYVAHVLVAAGRRRPGPSWQLGRLGLHGGTKEMTCV